MNMRIREGGQQENRGEERNQTDTLRLLSTSCKEWERKWKDKGVNGCWLADVHEWESPNDIISRKARHYLKNLKSTTTRKGLIGTQGFLNLDQCIAHARTVDNTKWELVHNDMLWFMMIEYGPKVGPSKIFTSVANDKRVSGLWPTVHGTRDNGNPIKRSVRELLRQRWDSLGLWALGLAKRYNYRYTEESQMEVLNLMKKSKLPSPRSVKRYAERKCSELPSDGSLQNLVESRERELALMGSESNESGDH